MTYLEQLQDPRWKTRRRQIIIAGNFRCEDCSSPFPSGAGLEVHHCAYLTGRLAWEYPDELLMPLCARCHEWRQGRQDAAFVQFGKAMRQMSRSELDDAVWTFLAHEYLQPFGFGREHA